MSYDDGERVEKMIADGRQIVCNAIETYKPLAVFAAYSGGNDSIVSTHFGCQTFGACALHCNTSVGIELTREHARKTCAGFGWQLREVVAKPEGKPGPLDAATLPCGQWTDGATAYEEFVLNYGFPGPQQHGRMYQRLKERSIAKVIAETKRGHSVRDHVLLISGIRHDESAIRAGYKRAVQKQGGVVWVNPFYWHTAEDFEAYRQEFGLPRNPVSGRIGISGECLCGAFAKEGEKELVRIVSPATAGYLDELESRVHSNGFPWDWGQRPPQWWLDARHGQGLLFEMEDGPSFQPMCVGCVRRRAS